MLSMIAVLIATTESVPEITEAANKVSSSISIADIANLGLMVLTLIGLCFTGFQLMQNKKINRANLVKELYFTLYNDPELRDMFYKIEWSNYDASERQIISDDDERKTDKLLSFFDIICNLHYRKILTEKDMEVFLYEMLRVYKHPSVQEYLDFLSEWQEEQKTGKSFIYFKKYCEKHKPET